MPALLSLSSVYNAILFYFAFGETIAHMHVLGMVVMTVGVVLLGFESGSDEKALGNEEILEESAKNGLIAMIYGVTAPSFFTIKAYAIRKYDSYKAWDLGIDALIFEYICYVIMYAVYVSISGFDLEDFFYGQVIGILFLVGKLTLTLAYAEGPGGPVGTLAVT